MSSSTTTDDLRAVLERASRALRVERRKTVDEREAFDSFSRRVRSIPPERPRHRITPSAEAQVTVHSPSTTGLTAVREAFEETVMSTPHYGDEYEESYAESIAGEFNVELAATLTGTVGFDQACKRTLLSSIDRAVEIRTALLETLNREAATLDDARETLEATADELDGIDPTALERLGFGALEGQLARLDVLERRCDELTDKRQEILGTHRQSMTSGGNGVDTPTYLYQSLQVDYPVLWSIGACCDRIESVRRRLQRAITRCG